MPSTNSGNFFGATRRLVLRFWNTLIRRAEVDTTDKTIPATEPETSMPHTQTNTTPNPGLYALLVGINNYPGITPLKGCVNDTLSLQTFLTNTLPASGITPQIQTLTDAEATKTAIVQQFRQHLGQAKKGDTVLFYFAGHGAQEEAQPVFWASEPDKKHEILVCYDATRQSATEEQLLTTGSDLCDKELRYLIHELWSTTQAHIVCIFDCCHSGDNTRNNLPTTDELGRTRKVVSALDPRTGITKKMRPWADFIFAPALSETDFAHKPLDKVLPQGNHIQMAACRSRESAYEDKTAPRGAFTYYLLQTLKDAEPDVSYYDLQYRVRYRLAKENYPQTPQIYAAGANEALLFTGFLNGKPNTSQRYGNVFYSPTLKAWTLDLGAIDGVDNDPPSEIQVFKPTDENTPVTAQIKQVNLAETLLQLPPNAPFLVSEALRAKVNGVKRASIKVFISGQDDRVKLLQQYFLRPDITDKTARTLEITNNPALANYHLIAQNNNCYLTQNGSTHPLIEQYVGYNNSALSKMLNDLRQISAWEFTKTLNNPKTSYQPNPPLQIELIEISDLTHDTLSEVLPQNQHLLPNLQSEYAFNLAAPAGSSPATFNYNKPLRKYALRINNQTGSRLYCALLYLSGRFGIYNLLQNNVIELEIGQTVYAIGGSLLEVRLEPYIVAQNRESWTEYLKLIISAADFKTERLACEDLPEPKTDDQLNRMTGHRGEIPRNNRIVQTPDWTTQLVTLNFSNPFYKKN